MAAELRFALNHMCAPGLKLDAFLDLALRLGIHAVEIRNDLAGQAILDGTMPAVVRQAAEDRAISILSINALQRFNDWCDDRLDEAKELIEYAAESGARALVLVPANDGSGREEGQRQDNLRRALDALAPMLSSVGLTGLVEPLGFGICSLWLKSEAVAAIRACEMPDVFRLVHDTFHHHLAGEPFIAPELTGLVHISGVEDPAIKVADMRDSHRVLVGPGDRLDNVSQLKAFRDAGYGGFYSFEPFAESVHRLEDLEGALRDSIAYLRSAPR